MHRDTRSEITKSVFAQASVPLGLAIVFSTVLAAVAGSRIIGDPYTHGMKVFLLPLLGIGAVLGVQLLMRLIRERQLGAFMKRSWPLFLFVVFDVAVLVVSTIRYDGDSLGRYGFYLNFLFIRLLVLAAYFAGLAVSRWRWDASRIVAFSTMLIATAFGIFEYWSFLHPNQLGDILIWWNELSKHTIWLFMDGPVTTRVMGLEIDPNFYASTAVIGVAYALAARIPMRLRFTIAALATVMFMLSQSRTAVFAAALLVIIFAGWRLYAFGWRRWLRKDAVLFGVLVVIAAVALGALWATGRQDPISARIEASIDLAEDSSKSIAITDAITNGRGTIWVAVWDSYLEKPWGSWEATVKDVGRNAHNEELDRLHWAGPPMLAVFLAAIVWMAFCLKTPKAPAFGLLAGSSLVTIGLMLQPTHLPGVMVLVMFELGALSSHEWLLGDGRFVSLGETKGA